MNKRNESCFASVLIIFFGMISQVYMQACTTTESVFPYYLGGTVADTSFLAMDIDSSSGNIAVAGFSSDLQVLQSTTTGTPPYQVPIIILIERPNTIKWTAQISNLAEAISTIKFSPNGSILVVITENAPLRLVFFRSTDGLLLGENQQQHPTLTRDPRTCTGNCIQFSKYSNSLYLSVQAAYVDPSSNLGFCCSVPRIDFTSICCTYLNWEVIKIDYTIGASSVTLNINWDKATNREGKANIIELVDSGTIDELFVGGYISNINTSTNREFRPAIMQQSGSDGTLRWAVSSNLGATGQYYEVTQLYVYKEASNSHIYLYSCTNDYYSTGQIGIQVLEQSVALTLPSTVRSIFIGVSSDYNKCSDISGIRSSAPNTHAVYALVLLAASPNVMIATATITTSSQSVTFQLGNYDADFSVIFNQGKFDQSKTTASGSRVYYIGQTAYTLVPSSGSRTVFTMNSAFIDSLVGSLTCSGVQTLPLGSNPSIAPMTTNLFTNVADAGLLVNVDLSLQNSWINPSDTIDTLKDLSELSSYNCGVLGPAVSLGQNKVISPTMTISSPVQYTVGNPALITSINDFTVQHCDLAGSIVLSYSVTTTPSALYLAGGSIGVAKNAGTTMLDITVLTPNKALVGTYTVYVKASLSNGEFNTVNFPLQILAPPAIDCQTLGIKVKYGPIPQIPVAKINITSLQIVQGLRGYIENNQTFYQSLLPYSLVPYTCGYNITYTFSMEDGRPIPQFLTFDQSLMRFQVNLKQKGNILGTYFIRLRAQANDTLKTYNDTAIWQLTLVGATKQQTVPNFPPHFLQSLKNLNVSLNSSVSYTLPQIIDDNLGDIVSVRLNLGSASSFINYSQANQSMYLNPTLISQIGSYDIEITLQDNHAPYPFSQTYYMSVTVVKVQQQQKPNISNNSTNQTVVNKHVQPVAIPSNPNITARIVDITYKGTLSIKFNRPLLVMEGATQVLSNSQVIGISIVQSGKIVEQVLASWQVVLFDGQTLQIQLAFYNPQYIAMSDVS